MKIFEILESIKEVALVYRDARSKTRPVITYSLLSPLQKRVVDILDLTRFQAP